MLCVDILKEFQVSTNNGSCLCGEILYRLNSRILNVVNCHCDFCRSHVGSAFSTYAVARFKSLEIIKGQDKINSYQINTGKKHFCSVCGTPLFNLNSKYPGACMLYLGSLENSRDIKPSVNFWCESKLKWVDEISSIESVGKGIERKNA